MRGEKKHIGGGSTSAKKRTFEQRAVANCCQNAVAISVALLSEESNERILLIVGQLTGVVLDWHLVQNKANRNAEGCCKWLREQAGGGYMAHVNKVAQCLRNANMLDRCGFITSPDELKAYSQASLGEVVAEDDFADVFGQLQSNLLVEREKRGLHLVRGWPWSMMRHKKGNSVLDQFLKDSKLFKKIKDIEDRPQALETLYQRHQMQQTSVQQLEAACNDPMFLSEPWDSDFNELLDSHAKVCCPTQIIEDCIGTQKAHRVFKQANRIRKPMKSMHIVLKQGTLDKKHGWKTPSSDVPVAGKMARLDESVWQQHRLARTAVLFFVQLHYNQLTN